MAKNESVIKDSVKLKQLIKTRILDELKLTRTQVVKDALKLGRTINGSQLSRYLADKPDSDKKKSKSMEFGLSEVNIVWLAYRYGIYPVLNIHTMPVYNEEICLETLKKIFKDENNG